ncbi:MAG: hypothetical protein HZB51_29220 [Chloroflexi bacterium]|nr:hypothetical protein [Chloroflexota bacterium]
MKKTSPLIFAILLVIVLTVTTTSASYPDVNPPELVFIIPVGPNGVQYHGGRPEMLTWGPTAFAIAPDGSFWIADTVGNRLLHYSSQGKALNTINLKDHQVVGIGDLKITASNILVLDIAAIIPRVLRLSPDGKLLASYQVPKEWGIANGLSGFAVGDQGQVLIEREGGAFVSQLADANGKVAPVALDRYTQHGRQYKASPADLTAANATRGHIIVNDKHIEVNVTHSLGGLRLLGVNADDDFFAVVDEVAIADSGVQVDQTVRHYNAAGELQGLARVPLAEQYTHVAHGLAVSPDGGVYALVTRPDRVEVQRLRFSRELKPILPAASAGEKNLQNNEYNGAAVLGCVTRDSMISTALGYINNVKYLSLTNTDGTCAGRGKPRYITGAGDYPSVSYDWGGWDTVSQFNGYMDPGTLQAGDVGTGTVENCSRGDDCSGFVTVVWQLTTKYSTRMIPSVSKKLRSTSALLPGDVMNEAGSHVVLFSSFGSNGIYDYESTTYNGNDRVIYMFSTWARLKGYSPLRFNNVCP